jgi:RNA polymerase sigma-70 factor, ECF subfamily
MEETRPSQQQYGQSRAAAPAQGKAGSVQDDAELLRRAAQGDVEAQHALIDRHGRYLFGVAHALSGNPHDAEDLVQETFMGAFRTRFRGESSLRTWLVKILMRRAGMLRRSRHRQGTTFSLDAATTSEPPADSVPGAGADARMDLTHMLAALSPEHRQVILLREIEGLSYEEIAEAIGVPRGTVESRLHRAREELRKRFKGYL